MTEKFLANRVRDRRIAKGISQEQLAEATKLQLKTIQKIEQGHTKDPHMSTIIRLATALGASIFYFYPPEKLNELPPADRLILELQNYLHSERELNFLRDIVKAFANYSNHSNN